MFRENLCGYLRRVASVRILFISLCVFDMISVNVTVHCFYIGLVDVLWKCILPLLADVKCSFLVCFTILFYDFGVLEGPNGTIFCILYWFYKCFVKIDVRVCGGLPVFEFCLFNFLYLIISVNVTVHLFYIGFVAVLWRAPGGHRAAGRVEAGSDGHRRFFKTLSKNHISRA